MTATAAIQPITSPHPAHGAGDGLPHSQGRRGGDDGTSDGKDSPPRAVPGDIGDAESFARDGCPLRIQIMAKELHLLPGMVLPYRDQASMSRFHFALKEVEDACRQFRRDVLPNLKNDFPESLRGELLDVKA